MLKGSNSGLPWRDPDDKLTDQSWSCTSYKNISMFYVNFFLNKQLNLKNLNSELSP